MRKGELSRSQIDREWPFQVSLPADQCSGTQYVAIDAFCRDANVSLAPRNYSYRENDVWHVVYCFAVQAHAAAFAARFGDQIIDPATRPRWPGRRR